MSIAAQFLGEFEREVKTTRRFLEQLPADKLSWKPHEKSMSAGQLALHIAGIPAVIMKLAKADVNPAPDFSKPFPQAESVKQILDTLIAGEAEVCKTLPTYTDAQMGQIWKLQSGDKDIMAMPRGVMLRSILFNHWYHHRGQLGVYLRLMGATVPSSYGPSGDEMPSF